MATRKKKTARSSEPTLPNLPPAPDVPAGIGVQAVRQREDRSLRVNARLAGTKSPLFPKGGSAFAEWCAGKGIHTLDKRPIEEWNELLRSLLPDLFMDSDAAPTAAIIVPTTRGGSEQWRPASTSTVE